MLKTGILMIFSLFAVFLTGCFPPVAYQPAFQPKIEESGGPKVLYSIRGDQLAGLFPIGSSVESISLRYGKPSMTGNGSDKNGKATSWIAYSYGRTYTHVDGMYNALCVTRFSTAVLTFDASGKLTEQTLSSAQRYVYGTTNRDATDEEVTRYLGAPEYVDIKVDPQASAKADQGQNTGWKLGLEISELRSEHVAKTGYTGRGVYIAGMDPQGVGAKYGLLPEDIIVKVNGTPTPTKDDLIDQLKMSSPAGSLELQVFSKGRLKPITIPSQQSGSTSSI